MCVYLLAKLEVSSIILTSVRRGVILPPQPQNKHLKTQPRLGLREFQILGKHSLVSSLPSIVVSQSVCPKFTIKVLQNI